MELTLSDLSSHKFLQTLTWEGLTVRYAIFVIQMFHEAISPSRLLVDVMSKILQAVLPPADLAFELDRLVCEAKAGSSSSA